MNERSGGRRATLGSLLRMVTGTRVVHGLVRAPRDRGPDRTSGHRSSAPRFCWKPKRRWWLTFAALFVMSVAWSLATPLTAAPDEPAHLIKAAAVVRGQLLGTPEPPTRVGPSPLVDVRVPEVFAETHHLPACFELRPDVPASCAPRLTSGAKVVSATTYMGRYPPLYYLAVGLPSLWFNSPTGIRLMRLVSALLCCIFLASAFESASQSRRSRLALLGVAIAVTPMVVFLNGTVNPNSLEIATSLCLWVSLLVLFAEETATSRRRMITRSGFSAAVLVEMRGLSVLWCALIAVATLAVAKRECLTALVRDKAARYWTAIVAGSTAFSLWWTVHYDALALLPVGSYAHASFSSLLSTSAGQTGTLLREMVGVVGWLDTPAPPVAFYGWLVLVAVPVVACLGFILWRDHILWRRLYVLGGLVVATVAVPIAIEASQARRLGFVWQGRYTLPLAVGIPVLATLSLPVPLAEDSWASSSARRATARIAVAVAAVVFVAQGAMFLSALRRYTVGSHGSLDPFTGSWSPPLGAAGVTALFFVALALYATLIVVRARTPSLSMTPRGASNRGTTETKSATEQLREGSEEERDVLHARAVAHAPDPPDLAGHGARSRTDLDSVALE